MNQSWKVTDKINTLSVLKLILTLLLILIAMQYIETRFTHLISKSCISSKVKLLATSSNCFTFSSFCFNCLIFSCCCTFVKNSPPFFNSTVDTVWWSTLTEGCCTTIVACCVCCCWWAVFLPLKCSRGLVVTFIGEVQFCSKRAPTCKFGRFSVIFDFLGTRKCE